MFSDWRQPSHSQGDAPSYLNPRCGSCRGQSRPTPVPWCPLRKPAGYPSALRLAILLPAGAFGADPEDGTLSLFAPLYLASTICLCVSCIVALWNPGARPRRLACPPFSRLRLYLVFGLAASSLVLHKFGRKLHQITHANPHTLLEARSSEALLLHRVPRHERIEDLARE